MKKIDLMLMLLFTVVFSGVAFSQATPLAGGSDCASAVPVNLGVYAASDDCANEWYCFTAPCDGEISVSDANTRNNGKRLWSGVCGSLTLEDDVSWSGTVTAAMTAGDKIYFESLNDNWCGGHWFEVDFENPACPQPHSLVSFASSFSTADIAWFAGGSEFEWTVVYGPAGFDPAVSGTTVVVGGSPGDPSATTLTGLTELTCYEYYVQANCGAEVSCFFSGPNQFCTPAICPTPLAPTELSITNTTTTLDWEPGDAEDTWDVEWGPEGFLLGGGTFIDDIAAFSETDLTGLTPDFCYDWYVRAVCDLNPADGVDTVSLWVGPEEWCTNRNCLDPSDLEVISAPGLTATLGWTANNTPEETEWNLQYGPPGFSLGSGVTVTNIPTNPYTLGGLTAGTDYCFYVQAVCGEGADSLSNWVGPVCFTTGVFCDEPTGLFATGTSGSDADLTWTAGGAEGSWEVSWGAAPLDDPATGTIETVDGPFAALSLDGLTAGETYCYYVRANCGEGADSASAWAGQYCWTQPALCATPFEMDVINITNTAANVVFTSPGAESWDIEWGAPCFNVDSGEEIGSVDATEDYPYYITGLEPSTPYWVYVRANCGVDSTSEWTPFVLFGTDITNDDACDAEALVLDGPAVMRHNFDATTVPGEGALAPDASGCFDSDGWCSGDGVDQTVWFSFVAPASGQVRVSTFDTSQCVTNSYTEIAIYSTGDCGILDNYELEAANTLAPEASEPPYGSEITACGLNPGQTYYVMVNPIGFIQSDIFFSIQATSIESPSAGLGLSPTICAGTEYDLFDAIAGASSEDGQWYNPTPEAGNELPNLVTFPAGAGSYDFYYVIDSGCEADTVMTTISTEEGVNAGGDGFYLACNTYSVILSDHLVGSYDGGGIWEYTGDVEEVVLAGGLFDPFTLEPGVYEFLYTVSNPYCETDSAFVTVTIEDCLGTDENELEQLEVYPNPVVDVLTVQNISVAGNAIVEVLDIEGRVVYSDRVNNVVGNYTIDMTEIESGVYFVKVTGENATQKVRVVKQ